MTFPVAIDPDRVSKVTFFKQDELTTDLVCYEISYGNARYIFHEEWEGWNDLVKSLEKLDGFEWDWFSHVSQPPFGECRFVAYESALQ